MKNLHSLNFLTVLITLSIFFSSCVTQKAAIKSQEKLHTGAEIVKPAWSYNEASGSKSAPYLGAVIGAGTGYFNKISYNGQEYKGIQSALIFGLAGYIGTVVIKNWVLNPKKRKYDKEDRDQWIKTYNKQYNYDFVILREYINNDLLLVPGNNISVYKEKAEEIERERALRQERDAALLLRMAAEISKATAPSKTGLDYRLSSFMPNYSANTNEAELRIFCNGEEINTYTIQSEKERYTCFGCWGLPFNYLEDLIKELLSRETCN